ncbi:ulp1 protease family, C-terminal catalytic domain-containing protein [Artemisia annua]|uniref:Ulp1 protease family, C-terminal catalytic domain-containing protein n=1 Tax=Artemisia annua TaxID=35608 RepID=A0A2U1P624_ARTAN|nr:ulp1 protease family, C-terminal catalytic domain-containing protein [Artemisia annua]
MDHYTWMYNIKRATLEYMEKLSDFMKAAEDDRVMSGKDEIFCPCKKCRNGVLYKSAKDVKNQLIRDGFTIGWLRTQHLCRYPQQKEALSNAQKAVQKSVAQVAIKQTPKPIQAFSSSKLLRQLLKKLLLKKLKNCYVVDVHAGVFVGQEESLSITVDANDILKMWTNGLLDASIIAYFNWGLYKLIQSSSSRCGLLNPYLIQGSECLNNTSGVNDYLTRAFNSTYDIFLAPFIEKGNHWVLFVVCPKQRMCYILDSYQPKDKKRTERSYWLTSCLNKFVANYKCNQQAERWECGHYILKWMHELVTVHQDHFPNSIPWQDNRPFSMNQIEDTIEKWHQLCPI